MTDPTPAEQKVLDVVMAAWRGEFMEIGAPILVALREYGEVMRRDGIRYESSLTKVRQKLD